MSKCENLNKVNLKENKSQGECQYVIMRNVSNLKMFNLLL